MPRSIDPSACFYIEGEDIVRGKGHFIVTEHLPADERTGSLFPLLLTTGAFSASTTPARRRGAPQISSGTKRTCWRSTRATP